MAAVMSIQTTLFGGVLKDVQHIYKVPRDAYEKFIEYDVKGGGGGYYVNVTMTLIFPKVVWTSPLRYLQVHDQ